MLGQSRARMPEVGKAEGVAEGVAEDVAEDVADELLEEVLVALELVTELEDDMVDEVVAGLTGATELEVVGTVELPLAGVALKTKISTHHH
jgi:hypothetical protein